MNPQDMYLLIKSKIKTIYRCIMQPLWYKTDCCARCGRPLKGLKRTICDICIVDVWFGN